MVPKENRLQLTISEKYPIMHEIIAHFRNKKISISDYLCSLAVKDYTSKSVESTSRDSSLPPIDKIVEYMLNTKMDLADEILRLHRRNELTDEQVVNIYLGIRALQIQLDNTKLIRLLIEITEDKDLIYSKRDTREPIAVKRTMGILVDRIKEAQKQLEKKEEEIRVREEEIRVREEERLKRVKWERENPGRDTKYMNIPKDKWAEEEEKDAESDELEEIPPEESDEE